MTHFIIFALVLYVLFRAAIRPRKTGPTEGRLVPRGCALDMEGMKREGSRRQRETDARREREWIARTAALAPYDRLAAYRPKET